MWQSVVFGLFSLVVLVCPKSVHIISVWVIAALSQAFNGEIQHEVYHLSTTSIPWTSVESLECTMESIMIVECYGFKWWLFCLSLVSTLKCIESLSITWATSQARVCVAWMADFLQDLSEDHQFPDLPMMRQCVCLGQTWDVPAMWQKKLTI